MEMMSWRRSIGYKHLVFVGVTLGVVYVWTSVHFSSKPILQRNSLTTPGLLAYKNEKVAESPIRDVCGLDLPFLDILDRYATCRIKLPLQSSCDQTKRLFSQEPPVCETEGAVQFCKFNKEMVLSCDRVTTCKSAIINIGYLDATQGVMIWTKITEADAAMSLKSQLEQIMGEMRATGYVFLRCSGTQDTQLLILPVDAVKPSADTSKQHININVIFIDSVSYYHFHRTLLKTTRKLAGLKESKTKVLSYPLYQSLKSRTYENLQALFSGQADTDRTFSTQSMPYTELKLEVLYKPLEQQGYTNLFTEDLCWHWEWGISKDLLVHNKSLSRTEYWHQLWKAFQKAGIHSYGVSPTSCEILEVNGHPDPFHGMRKVCYNGEYQHHYIFEHLQMFQNMHVMNGKPYSSFFSCNVPHDEWGLRVKTLDSDLATHIEQVTQHQQSNTLTILLSDHGNAYGEFPKYEQGRQETYHPVLYMIAPEKVQQILGAEVMNNLIHNQGRLVTVLDLHYLLMYIATPRESRGLVKQEGIISRISDKRTCSDLPLYQPNICICLDNDEGGLSVTEYSMIAEFASGYLTNHMISTVGGISNLNCRVLLPISYSHAQSTRYKDDLNLVTMDLNFESPKPGKTETILVSVFYKPTTHGENKLQIKAFERRTTYNIYWQCGNGGKIESLCICEKDVRYKFNNAQTWLTGKRTSKLISRQESHKIDNCIYVVQNLIDYKTSRSVSIVNICEQSSYDVKVSINIPKVLSHSTLPEAGFYVKPLDIQFAFVYKIINIPVNGVKFMKLFSFKLMPS